MCALFFPLVFLLVLFVPVHECRWTQASLALPTTITAAATAVATAVSASAVIHPLRRKLSYWSNEVSECNLNRSSSSSCNRGDRVVVSISESEWMTAALLTPSRPHCLSHSLLASLCLFLALSACLCPSSSDAAISAAAAAAPT